MSGSTTDARPLAITADDELLDDLIRLAAASGAVLDVSADASASRRLWSSAPLVLVGADLVADLARASPRRRDVIVVSHTIEEQALWEGAVELGAEHVVQLPHAEQWLATRIADALDGASREAVTVGVVGGRGGAGASTLAAALAMTGVRQGCAGFLVDGDPLGGGIELVLGGEDCVGMRWPDFAATEGRVSAGALRSALPNVDELVVLSWDRSDVLAIPPTAMRAVLGAARRGSDLVVVDLPRHLDEATVEALSQCATVLLVVPGEVRSVASAARVARLVAPLAADLRVVVRGPSPAGLDGRVVADALGLRLAGDLPAEPGLDVMLERGEAPARRGRGPLADLCLSVLTDLQVASMPPRRRGPGRGRQSGAAA